MADTVTVDIFRHAKADPKPHLDRLRTLSDKGREQALQLKLALGRPTYDLVIASPALRAVQTAALLTGRGESEVITIPELHWEYNPEFAAAMDGWYPRLTGKTPSAYYAEPNGALLCAHNERARETVWAKIVERKAAHVSITSHAVLAPGLGQAFCSNNRPMIAFLDLNLPEAAGFRMVIDRELGLALQVESLTHT